MGGDAPAPGLFGELKRRHVFRVAAMYGAVGWLLVEIASTVLPTFEAPLWVLQVLTFLVLLGFPLALVLAWAFELTPDGVRRDSEANTAKSTGDARRPALVVAVLVAGAVALAGFLRWSESEAPPGAGLTPELRSVAVLPFENMSGDAANEPFTLGIHDDLITHISKIGSIKTISRTSVLQYQDGKRTVPEIAKELGVATILEGGVQRAGDRVRINVQLIEAASDEHLWAETYDRELTAVNIFAIQSEIARSIAEALRATLSQEEDRRLAKAPTESLAAIETYFRGKQLLERRTRGSLLAAHAYFTEVIELDPDFALGHSGLADATMLLPEYVAGLDARESREASEAAAERALALDPDLPEALASVGWNRLIHYYDWDGAEGRLRRALAVQSNHTGALHWLSHVLSWQGRHEEAFRLARRAVEVDPNSGLMSMNLSYMHVDAGAFAEAIDAAQATIRRHPDMTEQLGNLWLYQLRAGQPEAASDTLVKWAERTGRDPEAVREVGQAFVRYRATGHPQALEPALIDRAEFGLEDLGQVHAFAGDKTGALDALERAYEERAGSRSVLSMKVNPGYDFLRSEPRFQALLGKVGLQ